MWGVASWQPRSENGSTLQAMRGYLGGPRLREEGEPPGFGIDHPALHAQGEMGQREPKERPRSSWREYPL